MHLEPTFLHLVILWITNQSSLVVQLLSLGNAALFSLVQGMLKTKPLSNVTKMSSRNDGLIREVPFHVNLTSDGLHKTFQPCEGQVAPTPQYCLGFT